MKKYILAAAFSATALTMQAQNNLHKLIDSVGTDWVSLVKFENKLYLQTKYVGGTQYEIDLTTHAKTPVAFFPVNNGQFSYESICHDFVVLNNKVSKVMKSATASDKYLVVADNSSYDTLLKVPSYFAEIRKVGNLVFFTTADNVYYTDFTPAGTVKIDTFAGGPGQYIAGSNYYYYVRRDPNNTSVRDIIRTNGTTSTVLETVTNGNDYIDFIGEQNGDFYYTVSANATTPTIALKKSTVAVPSALVNTFSIGGLPAYILTNTPASAAGLGKLFLMIKSYTNPYPTDLYAYDISANILTKVTDALTTNVVYAGNVNKAAFSDNSFYFYTTGYYRNLWKSDGTVAGTSLYADSVDARFYNPDDNYFTLPTTGIFCGDYPIAGINTEPTGSTADVEYQYGTSTGFNKFNLNAGHGSYPKDFAKINNIIYFLATESSTQFGKQSLFSIDGCGMPTAVSSTTKTTYEVTVSPNPSNGSFTVQGAGIDNDTKATLYNIQGQKVSTSNTIAGNSIHISTQGLPAGIYMLEVRGDGQVKFEKVSVQ